ncbi:MAG: cyclopropane-fatty-acyl-phospholipid synthase [Alphaproteobacteria bacterium CG11_big_fil_rev_8_21_14_0_20_44_7]|nr:MAG: cyclopropane-fatty-acyl-phospholipid synthase [Alphaproteobacteria bacterium CG11_big_fil_rev_8_21_14_0_20_44_7]
MIATNISKRFFLNAIEKAEHGSFSLTTPEGIKYDFEGKHKGPKADLVLHEWEALNAFLFKGDIGIAETYRDGKWDSSDLEALMHFGLINVEALKRVVYGSEFYRMFSRLAYLLKPNSLKGSKRNISAHYDLGNHFYSLWLDETMTYSAAIFNNEELPLPNAQHNKYDRMLDLIGKSGELLEIGCGWGGLAERAIDKYDHSVKGLTLSEEQHKYAKQRLHKYNGHANIELQDYRHEQKKFDNIVSIEMFEAVGEKYWDTYFQKISSCLKPKGKALIQTITVDDKYFESYRSGGDMIRSFIFPGGMLPSKEKFKHHANKANLKITDNYAFGKDYAKTLRHWLYSFNSKEKELDAMGFDNKFRRIWRLYLATCAASFEVGRTDVVQMELQHA